MEDRDEIRAARAWLDRLDEWIAEAPARPRLPALRVEHFSEGDDIVAYLGDTPGALVQAMKVSMSIIRLPPNSASSAS